MQQALTVVWVVGFILLPARPAAADPLCSLFKYCFYEGVAFPITVVDKETGQPLADVHALAEWGQYGVYGTDGPVMVQDAVSGPDGVLAFPAWGPVRGSPDGLELASDPLITLFKPGYVLVPSESGLLGRRVILNRLSKDTEERTRVRCFTDNGRTVTMEPFRGTVDEWVKELQEATSGSGGIGEEAFLRYRVPYLNRLRRLLAEQDRLPKKYQESGQAFWSIQREIEFLEKAPPDETKVQGGTTYYRYGDQWYDKPQYR